MTTKTIKSLDVIGDDMRRLIALRPDLTVNLTRMFIEDTIMAESKEICPRETGRLVRSATTEVLVTADGRTIIVFGYGTNYAVYVHERLEVFHKHPTQAKFLEEPTYRHIDKLPSEVADRITRLLMGAS